MTNHSIHAEPASPTPTTDLRRGRAAPACGSTSPLHGCFASLDGMCTTCQLRRIHPTSPPLSAGTTMPPLLSVQKPSVGPIAVRYFSCAAHIGLPSATTPGGGRVDRRGPRLRAGPVGRQRRSRPTGSSGGTQTSSWTATPTTSAGPSPTRPPVTSTASPTWPPPSVPTRTSPRTTSPRSPHPSPANNCQAPKR